MDMFGLLDSASTTFTHGYHTTNCNMSNTSMWEISTPWFVIKLRTTCSNVQSLEKFASKSSCTVLESATPSIHSCT